MYTPIPLPPWPRKPDEIIYPYMLTKACRSNSCPALPKRRDVHLHHQQRHQAQPRPGQRQQLRLPRRVGRARHRGLRLHRPPLPPAAPPRVRVRHDRERRRQRPAGVLVRERGPRRRLRPLRLRQRRRLRRGPVLRRHRGVRPRRGRQVPQQVCRDRQGVPPAGRREEGDAGAGQQEAQVPGQGGPGRAQKGRGQDRLPGEGGRRARGQEGRAEEEARRGRA